jgi:1-aminocyclopropane-1-carboxylate deaminase
MFIDKRSILTQSVPSLSFNGVETSMLRIDLIHAVVSGNKWFKLNYYLKEAIKYQKSCIASFGGAYSNHIVALAYICKEKGLQSKGFIRGEASTPLSPTLLKAKEYGMELIFVSRSMFNDKELIKKEFNNNDCYWINEGGYGILGALGASEILSYSTLEPTNIVCAVGTGTMIAGLIQSSKPFQSVTGISVLKNNFSIKKEITNLLSASDTTKPFDILHEFHFGGYAKTNKLLIDFMNQFWQKEKIPTDIVYTGKMVFAVNELINMNYFTKGTKLLIIHSGGLQGNCSLPEGSLCY